MNMAHETKCLMLLLVMTCLSQIEAGDVGSSVPESGCQLEWYSSSPPESDHQSEKKASSPRVASIVQEVLWTARAPPELATFSGVL
jgi:hypothetical protein